MTEYKDGEADAASSDARLPLLTIQESKRSQTFMAHRHPPPDRGAAAVLLHIAP
jgi:hypothetical protein